MEIGVSFEELAMSVLTPSPGTAADPKQRINRLTRRSLLMVPTFVVVYFITGLIGLYLVLHLLGLNEGDLFLMERGVAGWAMEVLFTLVLVSAPAAGVWFAVAALRRGGRWGALAGLVVNGLLVLLVIYIFVDDILMTYYPHIR